MSEIARALGRSSELWLDPQNAHRQETILALQVSTGYSSGQIELAIENCFQELTEPKINAYIASFARSKRRNLSVIHVLPANAFTAWVHGAVTSLLLGHRVLLKPSAREPVFSRAWKKSLEQTAPPLSDVVEIVSWDEKALHHCDAVVAYGSDETLGKIRSKLPQGMLFAGYGHKLSVGVIFKEALEHGFSDSLLKCVVKDAEPFRLQGCLSPQILYVQSASAIRWKALEIALDAAPKVRPFAERSDLFIELAKFRPYLSCVGFAGNPDRRDYLLNELKGLDVSRVCSIGEMQRPPLTWRNGGIFLPDLLH